ncbi:hypothetical protein [Ralstonia pseudosolanacearum]|uniref:hypothetical protein n=1 Tax=Ralstonia pseudosolanacearum TaxID=1310165 RepID=UPI003CF8154B
MIYLLLLVNFFVSWINCWSSGRVWVESRAIGGWIRVLAWCGAIQAAIGFSSVIGFLLGAVAYKLGYLPPKAAEGAAGLWYLLVIVPSIGTGLVITVESWVRAFREQSLMNIGTAAYNTFAQARNMYGAIDGVGSALGSVKDLFSADDDDLKGALVGIALLLVALSLCSGILLTMALIRRYAGTLPEPVLSRA